jgi:hypothetical protein
MLHVLLLQLLAREPALQQQLYTPHQGCGTQHLRHLTPAAAAAAAAAAVTHPQQQQLPRKRPKPGISCVSCLHPTHRGAAVVLQTQNQPKTNANTWTSILASRSHTGNQAYIC